MLASFIIWLISFSDLTINSNFSISKRHFTPLALKNLFSWKYDVFSEELLLSLLRKFSLKLTAFLLSFTISEFISKFFGPFIAAFLFIINLDKICILIRLGIFGSSMSSFPKPSMLPIYDSSISLPILYHHLQNSTTKSGRGLFLSQFSNLLLLSKYRWKIFLSTPLFPFSILSSITVFKFFLCSVFRSLTSQIKLK